MFGLFVISVNVVVFVIFFLFMIVKGLFVIMNWLGWMEIVFMFDMMI